MFKKLVLDINRNLFEELSTLTNFEDVCPGRVGAVIVDYKDGLIPIVRTTTAYKKPVQRFAPVHYYIIDTIKKKQFEEDHDIHFNNAMVEIYTSQYCRMGFHTDQALDLENNSYICLFSCYENEPSELRKLKIKNKVTKECSEILLENNSAVLFSTPTNRDHVHKIVLESPKSNNRWLGITFRLSKTFIRFNDGVPYLHHNNEVLRVADNKERGEFLHLKGRENSQRSYVYPEINYTINESDTLPMENHEIGLV